MPAAACAPSGPERWRRARVVAWVLYDPANTVYAAVVTFLFTPYAKGVLGELRAIGVVQFASMVLAGLLVPLLGALCDATARTSSYLRWATLVCVAAMAAFAAELGSTFLLAAFFVANIAYNLGILFYNTLLPAVAAPAAAGRVSGLGVGFGYLGTIAVLLSLGFLPVSAPTRFLFAAALFLVVALPCLLLIHDPRPARPTSLANALRTARTDLGGMLRELPNNRPLGWFLLGNFCLVDVLNTAVLYFADFTTDAFRAAVTGDGITLAGLPCVGEAGLERLVMVCGLLLNGLALPFGIWLGRWSDRSPLRVMQWSAVALLLALVGGVLTGGHSPAGYLLTLVTGGAFGLAGIWTAGRKVVMLLTPPDRIGAGFGLYGITLKLSVLGCLVYSLVADAYGCQAAMLAQSLPLLLGLGCLAMVRLPSPGHAVLPR